MLVGWPYDIFDCLLFFFLSLHVSFIIINFLPVFGVFFFQFFRFSPFYTVYLPVSSSLFYKFNSRFGTDCLGLVLSSFTTVIFLSSDTDIIHLSGTLTLHNSDIVILYNLSTRLDSSSLVNKQVDPPQF